MKIRTWDEQKAFERESRTEWLKQMAATGDCVKVCSDLYGIPDASLRNMASSHGVTFVKFKPKGKKESITKEALLDCLAKGLTAAESARALDVTEAGIWMARKRHGIVLPLHPKFRK